jgi:hypothetical protein
MNAIGVLNFNPMGFTARTTAMAGLASSAPAPVPVQGPPDVPLNEMQYPTATEYTGWFLDAIKDAMLRNKWDEVLGFVRRPRTGVTVNSRIHGWTLLMHLVQRLIKLYSSEKESASVWYHASRSNPCTQLTQCVQEMLDMGADVFDGQPAAVVLRSKHVHVPVLKLLVEHGAPVPRALMPKFRNVATGAYVGRVARWMTRHTWVAICALRAFVKSDGTLSDVCNLDHLRSKAGGTPGAPALALPPPGTSAIDFLLGLA